MMDSKSYPEIGARLGAVRKAFSDMNRREWAASHGFNVPQYTHWENGTRRIPIDSAASLVDRYGLTLDFIYRGRVDGLSDKARNIISGQSPNTL